MKIAIISGSIREGQATESVARYVAQLASQRAGEATYELVNIKDFDIPLLTSPVVPAAAAGRYDNPAIQRWADKIGEFDAFIFVTPEYNHGVPGAFKNAVDALGIEWMNKPVAFVGHGSIGGVRAIEQWRQITANFNMPAIRSEVNFMMFEDWTAGDFTPLERRAGEVEAVLSGLEQLTSQLAK
ncbi:NADPH-dependent FMN reductase [Actinotignum sanguinis]|uniref:NADPH-dependent FMN reductase n=1 Tax=Actinomycetaceae TaxID=2049 RepID=UPI000F7E0357|nr:NAD(P)H-dependent oxidoreductase [Actinotignum sanguinis]MDK7196733.1 NAD(P)H-dependent oxidoreductase [Actinotignum sanguinis]MDY5147780.1 NAD(P)H-dependent oxidoreductase [Actinotignum sanguinis]RTE50463.1 NADPH-dependent FMN reductase [Actinotignum sanguinis]